MLTSGQDYPLHGDLKTVHPGLYDVFMHCIMQIFEVYVSPHGPLNLFSYFLQGSLIPDLGTYGVVTLGCIVELVFP